MKKLNLKFKMKMSAVNKDVPIVIYNSSISNKNKKKQNKNNTKIKKIQNFSENKENISLNIIPEKVKEEDDYSSTNSLKSKEKEKEVTKEKQNPKEVIKISPPAQPVTYQNKINEKYIQKMKEKTMREEMDKIYKETERQNQKYEIENSYIYLFGNNPQFQKFLKKIEKQLIYCLIEAIFINIFSSIFFFKVTGEKEGIVLTSFCLSIGLFVLSIILFISLKIGLLSDPYLSRSFRFFVVLEFILLSSSLCFNTISVILNTEEIIEIEMVKYKILIVLLFILILVGFVATVKYCFSLFFESLLILLGKKTEYSLLMLNEKRINKDNSILNFSTSITSEGLNKTNIDLLNENNKTNNAINKDDEKYRNYNYFSKFHYSISSNRKEDYYIKYIKKLN